MTRAGEQGELQVGPDRLDGVDAVIAEPCLEPLLASVHAGCELERHGASGFRPVA
jgi:hypothetical protein